MRILYFHQHFSTRQGSTGTRSYEFAKALLARGHEVTIVCGRFRAGRTGLDDIPLRRGRREGFIEGIRVIEFDLPYGNKDGFLKRSMTFARFAFRCVGVALKEKYDLLFATSTPLTVAIPALSAKILRGKPYVFEVRDLWPEIPEALGVVRNPLLIWGLRKLEKTTYRLSTACIGLSPGIVEGIKKRGGPAGHVHLVSNGCDLDLFHPSLRRAPHDVFPVNRGDFVAIFSGTHGLANGLGSILDVAEVLHRRGRSDIRLVLVGDGMQKPQLRARAERGSLSACVFMDPVPKEQLAVLLASSDVGMQVLTNIPAFHYGTSPNKFFDYIASGLPVLNNYPGWLADMLRENSCGLVVPPGDAEAFADALEALAAEPELRKKMGVQSRRLAETLFDRKRLGMDFVRTLEERNKLSHVVS